MLIRYSKAILKYDGLNFKLVILNKKGGESSVIILHDLEMDDSVLDLLIDSSCKGEQK